MRVSAKTKQVLDIPYVLEKIGDLTRSPLGSLKSSSLQPFDELEKAQAFQGMVQQFCRLQDECRMPWCKIEPLDQLYEIAQSTGFFDLVELMEIRQLLEFSRDLKTFFVHHLDGYPALEGLIEYFKDFTDEITSLQVIDQDGTLSDRASEKYATLRQELENVRHEGKSRGLRLLNGQFSKVCRDKQLFYRDGRFLVLIKAGAASQQMGRIVERMDQSVYFEPDALLSVNNRMIKIQEALDDEIRRICRVLSEPLMKRWKAIALAQEGVALVDLFGACHQLLSRGWNFPQLVRPTMFSLKDLRHPLLGAQAVPQTLHCGQTFTQLVITGPNTGGKTIALKSVAVALFLGWCGLPIPAREDSQIGFFDQIFVDIGDEQSLQQSLSTFSAHLVKVVDALRRSTAHSLVILDELGAGTDPREGAALGVAMLEELREKNVLTLASTHHNGVKHYATTTFGVEAASVDFNEKTLQPTYRLLIGVPGQSNALHIARRYGMPAAVLDRAKHLLDNDELNAERLMGQLRRRASALDKKVAEQEQREKELDQLQKKLRLQRESLDRKKDQLLLKAEHQAQKVVYEAEEQARLLLKDLQGAAVSAGHKVMQRHKEANQKILDRAEVRGNVLQARAAVNENKRPLQIGDYVKVAQGMVGELTQINGKKGIVSAGPLSVEVNLSKLTLAQKPKIKDQPVQIHYSSSDRVGSSLMVRGSTVDEALPQVATYLDRALRAGYGEVTIIHGRGEGILRKAVHQYLDKCKFVRSYRLGDLGEGGYGVTIVTFD